MKCSVNELSGGRLDEAVALAEGWQHQEHFGHITWAQPSGDGFVAEMAPLPWSHDWECGGRIIERERITIAAVGRTGTEWFAEIGSAGHESGVEVGYGMWQAEADSPLTAAMRAYVLSKLGREVDL